MPTLPRPDMYFDDTSDFDSSRVDIIHYIEEYDKLSLSASQENEQSNTLLVQAQIETDTNQKPTTSLNTTANSSNIQSLTVSPRRDPSFFLGVN